VAMVRGFNGSNDSNGDRFFLIGDSKEEKRVDGKVLMVGRLIGDGE